jgi:hypothetical protein
MAREFPIANGKLVTDLDANGFKILNIQGGGGGSGGTTDYNDLNNIPKMNGVEVSGSKSAEDYGLATKEQLNAVKETAENKRDKTDNIAAVDSMEFTKWKFRCDVPEIQAALDASPVRLDYDSYNEGWIFRNLPEVEGWIEVGNVFHPSGEDISTLIASPLYVKVHGDGTADEISITVTREKVVTTKSGEPYVTPTGVKNIAIPKYEFVIGSLKQEEDSYFVTLEPYHCTVLNGEDLTWPYFKVEAGGESGKVRDCILMVDLTGMEDPPTITWPANFHPRTDADTDFKCEAGKRNVYWITEYAEGEFVVAGWQETEGGNAQ